MAQGHLKCLPQYKVWNIGFDEDSSDGSGAKWTLRL